MEDHQIQMIGPVSCVMAEARETDAVRGGDLNLHFFRNQILSPSTHPITVGNSCRDGALLGAATPGCGGSNAAPPEGGLRGKETAAPVDVIGCLGQ